MPSLGAGCLVRVGIVMPHAAEMILDADAEPRRFKLLLNIQDKQ